MIQYENIKKIQLEISTHCNAACPQCPRNYYGGGTITTLPLKNWSLSEFKKIFTEKLLYQLEQVYFCGTYGDPMSNPYILEMCKWLKSVNSSLNVGIHTNGSLGKPITYQNLAQYTDFIAFGIDGLEDTNHIYRRGVKWKNILKNTDAFIKSGGYAIWDFIVFGHNEHQVKEAREMSQSLGFAQFNIKKTGRFFNRRHKFQKSLMVYNKQNFIDYSIKPPSNPEYVNESYKVIENMNSEQMTEYLNTTNISCNACNISEIYIGAEGFVFPCGWLHDRLYGPEVETSEDHFKLKALIENSGGVEYINVFFTPLKNIVNGPWFKNIESSWKSNKRLERCAAMCGEKINVIKYQNSDIKYKE